MGFSVGGHLGPVSYRKSLGGHRGGRRGGRGPTWRQIGKMYARSFKRLWRLVVWIAKAFFWTVKIFWLLTVKLWIVGGIWLAKRAKERGTN